MTEPQWLDDGSDDLADYEYPDEDDSDEKDFVTCPVCGRDVYEELQQCPHCEHYIVHDTSIWSGRPTWWILLAVLGIISVLYFLVL